MATNLYFVRHGQVSNADNITYGRMPGFMLSEAGQAQAQKLANFFKDKEISAIYTSPLERAFQTAELIFKACPTASLEHLFDLNEAESTNWQGLSTDQLFTNDSYEQFLNNPDAQIGTENLNQLALRMKKVLDQILQKNTGKNIVCVSHEFPILVLKLTLEQKPLTGLKTYHLAVGEGYMFQFDESGKFIKTETFTA